MIENGSPSPAAVEGEAAARAGWPSLVEHIAGAMPASAADALAGEGRLAQALFTSGRR